MSLPRRKPMALAIASTLLLLAACGSGDDAEFDARLTRTAYGMPHIQAEDERGLGYGVGYAYAQDNLCVLANAIVTVNGERSRHFGAQGTYDPDGGGGSEPNLPSDFYYKWYNDDATVQASWARQQAAVKDLVTGYVAGYNRYLRDTPAASRPAACRDAAWVRPITELDMIRLMRRYAVAGSGSNFMSALYAAQPPAATAAASATREAPAAAGSHPGYTPAPEGYWKRFRPELGSNGVALGKDVTESGRGLLLANPHFPWLTEFRFYQMHLTIPGKLDVMGASLGGFPLVNIGFNQNVAWTHTVNTSVHFTLYALQLDPADPKRYVLDGQSRAMTPREITVQASNGQGGTVPITRTFWFTEFGPMVTLPGVLDWTSSAGYAFADANAQNDRMFDVWWAINHAGSVQDVKAAVDRTLGIPWVHTIAADKAGNAYYGDVTVVPHVDAAREATCIPAPFAPLKAQGIFVLAGTTSACKWGNSPGTPQPGIFAASEMPSLIRTDYVQNSNDSAWLTHPAQLQTGYPSVISVDSQPQGGRTRIGLAQIADRLAGTDGRPGNKFSMASLQDIAFSNRSYFATVLLEDLRAVCAAGSTVVPTASGNVDIAPGCNVLANWDGKANVDSVGWPLFNAWRDALDAAGSSYWRVPFNAADPVHTPRGLRSEDAAVAQAARTALAQAMTQLAGLGLDYTRPWGQIQVAERGADRIPVHGGTGADVYNAMYCKPTAGGICSTYYGSSIVWTVSFEGDAPKAQGWLTYSQSTDPASPYYADQTRQFSGKQWITWPYTQAQIDADPKKATRRLKE